MSKVPDQIKFRGAHYVRADIYTPKKGESDIDPNDLMEVSMELEPADAASLATKLNDINSASKSGSSIPESVAYKLLTEANDVLQGFGVESLPAVGGDADPPAVYVNTGDMYTATVLWDFDDQLFYVTTPGDWLAAWENQKGDSSLQPTQM